MKKPAQFILVILIVITLTKISLNFLQERKEVLLNKPVATPTPYLNHAINLNSLNMLTYWTKGITEGVTVTANLKGKIIAVETDGVVVEHGWPAYNYALKIRIEQNNDSNDIFFTKEELQKTEFIQNNKLVNYKELKLNDNVQITLTFDLTKEFGNNFVSAEVIKL